MCVDFSLKMYQKRLAAGLRPDPLAEELLHEYGREGKEGGKRGEEGEKEGENGRGNLAPRSFLKIGAYGIAHARRGHCFQ